jgi:hypothetical protein
LGTHTHTHEIFMNAGEKLALNLFAFSDKIVILFAVTAPIENFLVTCLTCTPHNAIWFLTVVLSRQTSPSPKIPNTPILYVNAR